MVLAVAGAASFSAMADNKAVVYHNTDTVTLATKMGEQKVVEIIVPAGRGVEYKLVMNKLKTVKFNWHTDGASIYYDQHGEPHNYAQTKYFESYMIGNDNKVVGQMLAPFTGSHGWYWKNMTKQPVKVTLTFQGEYTSAKLH